jgi:hypothetical protein
MQEDSFSVPWGDEVMETREQSLQDNDNDEEEHEEEQRTGNS